MTLFGFGLDGTEQILFGYLPAPNFSVRDGREIDVVVPGSPNAVTVDIHLTIRGMIGTRTLRQAYSFDSSMPAYVPSTPQANAPASPKDDGKQDPITPRIDFLTFREDSSQVTPTMRRRLNSLAQDPSTRLARGTVITYSDTSESPGSLRLARARGANISKYLAEAGFQGSLTVRIRPASTPVQERGALIHFSSPGLNPSTSDRVSSLIVRLDKGRSIVVDGAVRGAERVTGGLGDLLKVGPYLGLRMYRIDFPEPVSAAVAERVARQLSRDPGIAFAEPDSLVSTQVATAL